MTYLIVGIMYLCSAIIWYGSDETALGGMFMSFGIMFVIIGMNEENRK